MTPILRASVAVLLAAPALVTSAIAQDGGGSADMMTVYVGSAAGGSEDGTTIELSLEEAAEACGVDLKVIQAWAESDPRYCVALHMTAAVEEALGATTPAGGVAAPAQADEGAPAQDQDPAEQEAAPTDDAAGASEEEAAPAEGEETAAPGTDG